jgi:hypothetical protein
MGAFENVATNLQISSTKGQMLYLKILFKQTIFEGK